MARRPGWNHQLLCRNSGNSIEKAVKDFCRSRQPNAEGVDLTWHDVDTKLCNINRYHFAYALGKLTSNVLFWAVNVLDCPGELKDVRLAIGSNAASVWWVNGKEVIGIYGDRQTVIDDGVSKRLTLKKGPNVVRLAVVNGGGATDFARGSSIRMMRR